MSGMRRSYAPHEVDRRLATVFRNAMLGAIDVWTKSPKRCSLPRFRLFCFPPAGREASTFDSWTNQSDQTYSSFRLHRYPGNHFFADGYQKVVLAELNKNLNQLLGTIDSEPWRGLEILV